MRERRKRDRKKEGEGESGREGRNNEMSMGWNVNCHFVETQRITLTLFDLRDGEKRREIEREERERKREREKKEGRMRKSLREEMKSVH